MSHPTTATLPTTVPPAAAPAVHLLDVRKTHPDGDGVTEALRGVTLALRRGSFTAVMGPSGSGKTTLLTVAAGLDTATSGRVLIGGHDLTGLDADALTRFRREHVGFVFQAYNLVDHLSVRENIELPVRLAGGTPDPAWRDHLQDVVGLHGLDARRPNELSGGQGQRVAIARALFTRPDIVFADEPTGALDSTTAADVLALLRDTARELGQTVVVVTHDARVAAVADRVLFLADGRLVDELDDPTTDRIAARLPRLGR